MSTNQQNAHRVLIRFLREICAERSINIAGFSDDWLFCLQKNGRTTYVFGYDFGLNSATAGMICRDKSATSDLLGFHRVPRVEHRVFHGPQLKGYIPMTGNWQPLLEYFEACNCDVVCKPNDGTGGRGVVRVRTPLELESAVVDLLARHRSLCVSPHEAVSDEYRVALLNGEVQFVYRKRPLALTGDGQTSLRDLLLARWSSASEFRAELETVPPLMEQDLDYEAVPPSGAVVPLNWRHNLGQGASPEFLDPNDPKAKGICDVAIDAARVLAVNLASVDIVESVAGYKVLELNCGIMMESLVRSGPQGSELARRLYERIVCLALELDAP